MRTSLLLQHVEVPRTSTGLMEAEMLRMAGAFAALIVAALLLAAGLIWREHAGSADARFEPPVAEARVG